MEPRAHHVLIGLFTFVAFIVAILFVLWLGKAHQQRKVDYYEVVFNEPVRGLSRGGTVLYNGIRIGEVVELKLDPADLRTAHARIAIDSSIPVRQDTQARLTLAGITGVSVIELSGGSPLSPLLMDPPDGDPIIIATPSPLTQLLSGSDTLMTNISELVLSAKNMLSEENLIHFGNTLENLDAVTGSLASQRDDMQSLLTSLTAAADQVDSAMTQAGALLDTTNNLIAQQGAATFEHARKAMAAFERTSEQLNQLIQENQASVASGARGLGEVGPALQALRQTLLSIQDMVHRLDNNPSAYLLGRDQIQEFEP